MCCLFMHDPRLGIKLPVLKRDWELLETSTQSRILAQWEAIRGQIPERIAAIERNIEHKQAQLDTEENFDICCRLNEEIAERASIINDLWIWYRTHPDVSKT
ncbi:hypothetical protein SAMN05192534_10441 [Alteribacillus persepolensis]|uniref:Uncharacterized protein n=1 Tax=Alteribacillus persepolensis TaxID=568899 RepID=A0A1G8BGR6_9BACI|nr:hypothetical protein [Alteribacillus persepolensis]SDH32358.1 hypothetical protein SAMN05192534_10441 [Alteribacillus persepolensis]